MNTSAQSIYQDLLKKNPEANLLLKLFLVVVLLLDRLSYLVCSFFQVSEDEFGKNLLLVPDVNLFHHQVNHHYPDQPNFYLGLENQYQADSWLVLELVNVGQSCSVEG